jgi:hypothetical protein
MLRYLEYSLGRSHLRKCSVHVATPCQTCFFVSSGDFDTDMAGLPYDSIEGFTARNITEIEKP